MWFPKDVYVIKSELRDWMKECVFFFFFLETWMYLELVSGMFCLPQPDAVTHKEQFSPNTTLVNEVTFWV